MHLLDFTNDNMIYGSAELEYLHLKSQKFSQSFLHFNGYQISSENWNQILAQRGSNRLLNSGHLILPTSAYKLLPKFIDHDYYTYSSSCIFILRCLILAGYVISYQPGLHYLHLLYDDTSWTDAVEAVTESNDRNIKNNWTSLLYNIPDFKINMLTNNKRNYEFCDYGNNKSHIGDDNNNNNNKCSLVDEKDFHKIVEKTYQAIIPCIINNKIANQDPNFYKFPTDAESHYQHLLDYTAKYRGHANHDGL